MPGWSGDAPRCPPPLRHGLPAPASLSAAIPPVCVAPRRFRSRSAGEPGDGASQEPPLLGTQEAPAEAFRGFVHEGSSLLQLRLTPNTVSSPKVLAPALDLLARAQDVSATRSQQPSATLTAGGPGSFPARRLRDMLSLT